MVLKLDSTALQEQLGDNGVDPRWALAWKFAGAVAATQLLVRAGSRAAARLRALLHPPQADPELPALMPAPACCRLPAGAWRRTSS